MKTEKSPVGIISLLGLIYFYMTDAINSGGETWTEYNITAQHSYVSEYHAYYNSNARLTKIRFRTSSHIGTYEYILSGLLHGYSSDYHATITYIASYGSGEVTRSAIVDVSGVFYVTDTTLHASGSNYIEFIYPYYS